MTALEQSHPEQMYQLGRERHELLEGIPWASQQKKDMLFGAGSSMHDPSKLIQPSGPAHAGTQIAPTMSVLPPKPTEGAGTVAVRKPRPKLAMASLALPVLYGQATHEDGRTLGDVNADPTRQVSSAFEEQQRQLDIATPDEPKLAKAHKLHARVTFRGLPISIETAKGDYRHWYDPHADKHGKTKMPHAYGYIRRTKGLDGDHVDVFVGPNEKATHVHVVMTKKAPDFKELDEEKCMLGFDSEEDARAAFAAAYDKPGFFHSIKSIPFAAFEKRVFETFDGTRKKVAWDPGTVWRKPQLPPVAPHNGTGAADLQHTLGVNEKSLGYPPVGAQRHIIDDPMDLEDRVDRQFRFMDLDQHTTAIENTDASDVSGPLL